MITRLALLFSVLGWLVVGGLIIDQTIAPRGTSVLRWTSVTQPSPVFQWSVRPEQQDHRVILQPGEAKEFSVTLPRGFVDGRILVATIPWGSKITISAEPRPGQPPLWMTSNHEANELSVTWSDLIARGHTYRFTISPAGPTPENIFLTSITVFLNR